MEDLRVGAAVVNRQGSVAFFLHNSLLAYALSLMSGPWCTARCMGPSAEFVEPLPMKGSLENSGFSKLSNDLSRRRCQERGSTSPGERMPLPSLSGHLCQKGEYR